MPRLRSGNLRHRFEVQSGSEVQDSLGSVTRTWATDDTRWGDIEQLTAQERLAHQQQEASEAVRITLRYYAGLTTDQRLKRGSDIYEIRSVNNMMERDHVTVVIAAREI